MFPDYIEETKDASDLEPDDEYTYGGGTRFKVLEASVDRDSGRSHVFIEVLQDGEHEEGTTRTDVFRDGVEIDVLVPRCKGINDHGIRCAKRADHDGHHEATKDYTWREP